MARLTPGGAGTAPEWKFFLVPSGDCAIRDTWFTAGMRATGSKTIATENAFVPSGLVLKLNDLRDGRTPGGALLSRCRFPHAVFVLRADRGCDADARRSTRRLRTLPRMDQDARARKTARRSPPRLHYKWAWRAPPPVLIPPISCCAAPTMHQHTASLFAETSDPLIARLRARLPSSPCA